MQGNLLRNLQVPGSAWSAIGTLNSSNISKPTDMILYLQKITFDTWYWNLGRTRIHWCATYTLRHSPTYPTLRLSHTYGATAKRLHRCFVLDKLSPLRRPYG